MLPTAIIMISKLHDVSYYCALPDHCDILSHICTLCELLTYV